MTAQSGFRCKTLSGFYEFYKDIIEDRNQVRDKALVLEMVDEGNDVLPLNDSSSVLVRIGTRIASNTQSLNLDTMALLFIRSKNIEKELENA
ncbi:hypothetical protein HG530_002618 [Fusarium avenaceum]|nr:hypothetical protein HG530_002618 [Fusarium avenaceum]